MITNEKQGYEKEKKDKNITYLFAHNFLGIVMKFEGYNRQGFVQKLCITKNLNGPLPRVPVSARTGTDRSLGSEKKGLRI